MQLHPVFRYNSDEGTNIAFIRTCLFFILCVRTCWELFVSVRVGCS